MRWLIISLLILISCEKNTGCIQCETRYYEYINNKFAETPHHDYPIIEEECQSQHINFESEWTRTIYRDSVYDHRIVKRCYKY